VIERLETLVIARMITSARPIAADALAAQLQRFAPPTATESAWRDDVAAAHDRVRAAASAKELARRIGKSTARTWQVFADRVFPALALGIAPDDKKAHARLAGRDAWTAAIAGRTLGTWRDGPPPSIAELCDAFAWQKLGLAGKPKRCPPEIRAVFIARELALGAASSTWGAERLLRIYAAKEIGAPRTEPRAVCDALVRCWLAGKVIGAHDFAGDVRAIASCARDGVFGDRKVFISAVWDELRRRPAWSALTLDDFKARLLGAHRTGDLVLARADLVGALDPGLVAASETSTDGASFHFIVREDPT
jgi:hypothetical protein